MKRKIKGVPATVNTVAFREIFDGYVNDIAKVHGPDAAETYSMLREGEALVMRRVGADYPDAETQQQDFLSLRLEHLSNG